MQTIIRIIAIAFIILPASKTISQNLIVDGFSKNKNDFAQLNEKFIDFNVFEINTGLINTYINQQKASKEDLNISLKLSKDYDWKFSLFQTIIFHENYQMKVVSEKGITTNNNSLEIAYEGQTSEGYSLRLTINRGFISGYIEDRKGKVYIEPLTNLSSKTHDNLFVIYKESDIKINENFICLAENVQRKKQEIDPSFKSSNTCFVAPIAIANDFSMFLEYGSDIGNIVNQNVAVLNVVNADYDDNFSREIKFQISEHVVSTCNNCDPWPNFTNARDLLSNFSEWGEDGFDFYFAIGTLWTNRIFDGDTVGIAFVDGLCRNNKRYNVNTENAGGLSFGQLRNVWTHEIGHNFASEHDPENTNCIMAPSIGSGLGNTCWSNQSTSTINSTIVAVTQFGGCLFNCVCRNDVNMTRTILSGESLTVETSNQITASNTINDNSNVLYDAGVEVVLQPGFVASSGSTFEAIIRGCSSTRIQEEANRTFFTSSESIDFKPSKNSISIYPNPTKGNLHIDNREYQIARWQLFNRKGTLLKSNNSKNQLGEIITTDISNLQTGIYFIRIELSNGEIVTKRVLKK